MSLVDILLALYGLSCRVTLLSLCVNAWVCVLGIPKVKLCGNYIYFRVAFRTNKRFF